MLVGGKPWADQPYPRCETESWESRDANEHASIRMALEMVRAHNYFILGLNAIVLQGPNVKEPKDKEDFMYFCHALVGAIHHHHSVEETTLFPQIEKVANKPGLMEKSVEQHEAFQKGLDEFEAYVTKTKGADMEWVELKKIIDSFVSPLMTHLNDEIVTLKSLRDCDSKELWKAWEMVEAEAKKIMNGDALTDIVPLALGCCDKTYENGLHKSFPPVPFFIPYLTKWFWSKKHEGAWRFNPCDEWGQPRPLQFVNA